MEGGSVEKYVVEGKGLEARVLIRWNSSKAGGLIIVA